MLVFSHKMIFIKNETALLCATIGNVQGHFHSSNEIVSFLWVFHLPYSKYKGVKISVNQYLLHNLGYKQKIQVIRRNQVYFSLFYFIQLVLDNDCCISRNVGRIKVSLVTSNNLYILCENMFFTCVVITKFFNRVALASFV